MPHPQQSSAQAVPGPNLLFSLPPEIRTMIYCLLLTHEERAPIIISSRDFLRRSERIRALKRTHDAHLPKVLQVKPPSLSPSIIRVCRLIHLEACPLLYSLNSLKFYQPSALRAYIRRSDPKYAFAGVKSIIMEFPFRAMEEWREFFKEVGRLEHPLMTDFSTECWFHTASGQKIDCSELRTTVGDSS